MPKNNGREMRGVVQYALVIELHCRPPFRPFCRPFIAELRIGNDSVHLQWQQWLIEEWLISTINGRDGRGGGDRQGQARLKNFISAKSGDFPRCGGVSLYRTL